MAAKLKTKLLRLAGGGLLCVSIFLAAGTRVVPAAGTVSKGETLPAAGFVTAKLEQLDQKIDEDVAAGFPGAVLCLVKDGQVVRTTAYGWQKKYDGSRLLPREQWQPMRAETMFDLASNTKMYATNLALMKLTDEGRVSPEDLVCRYVPECTGGGKESLRLRDLLTHSAGFAPSPKFYRPNGERIYTLQREETQRLLSQLPLEYPTGTKYVYSDTDYLLLGLVVERITGQGLDAYVEQNIYQPLGLTHTVFNPLEKGFKPDDFAAGELNGNTRDGRVYFPGIRTGTVQGEVHDETAFYLMGGVSGHAGLFSRASDLAVLTGLLLNGGSYGSYKLCSPETLALFLTPSRLNPSLALGWYKGGSKGYESWFGPYAGQEAFGHTGWTGTFICVDPARALAVIWLTNRTHAPVAAGQINSFAFDQVFIRKYGHIMQMVYEALAR